MKKTSIKYLGSLALAAWLAMILLGQGQGQAYAQARRPLPKLDTKRGLYIRPDGTRVYKDPLPPKKRLYTYKRRDGKTVQQIGGPGHAYSSKKRPAHRPATKNRSQKKRSTRRR